MKKIPVIVFLAFILGMPMSIFAHVNSTTPPEDSSNALFQRASTLLYIREYTQAKNVFNRSLQLRKEIYGDDHIKLAPVYANVAYIQLIELEYDSALINYMKSEVIYRLNKKDDKLGGVYNSIGIIYFEKGEFQKAIEHYNICEEYYKKNSVENSSEYFYLYNAIAATYMELGNLDEAEKYYDKVFNSCKINYRWLLPNLYNKLYYLFILKENYNKAICYAKEGIKNIENENTGDLSNLALLYNNIGYAYMQTDSLEKAEMYLRKSDQLNHKIRPENHYLNAYVYNDFGLLYEKKEQPEKALKEYQKSINCLSYTNNTNYSFNPRPDDFFDMVEAAKPVKLKRDVLYQLFTKTGDMQYMKAALETAQLSIDLLDAMRNSFQTRESKLFLAENENEAYIKALFLAKEAWKATGDVIYLRQAFAFAEKGKAAVLLSAIRNSKAKVSGQLPEELLQKEKDYDRQIAYYNDLLYGEKQQEAPDNEKISGWENQLFYLKRERETLVENIEKNHPEYYRLKYNTGVVSVEKMQKYLGRSTTLVEYVYTDTLVYAFVISRNSLSMVEIPINKTFAATLDNYLMAYQRFDILGQGTDDKLFFDASYALYDVLIKPLEPHIKNDRLLIVPDDKLAYLPFEALLSSKPALPVTNYKHLDYLINRYIISYIYSSTLLLEERSFDGKNRGILAFAPEYSVKDSPRAELNVLDKLRMSLPSLKGTYEEAEFLKQNYKALSFTGDSATESFFNTYAPGFSILHLAMHTLIDDENPMFSKLVFAYPGNDRTDGFINTHELYSMNLSARLAVLSSCSTGEGKINKGEGIMNLSRGFFYAGCPSLIITLWKVNDKSGTELMQYFYEELSQGKSKPEALRNAKLRYLENARPEISHPFFWATYVSVGDPVAIYPKRRNKLLFLLIPVVIIGIGIIYRKFFYRKK